MWRELRTVRNERVLQLMQNLQPASESPGLCSHLCKITQGDDLGITGFRNHRGEFKALVAQTVKNLLAMQETQVQSLEDPLENGMQPTPVFLPGEFHGQRSLVGYSPWGSKSHTQLRDFHFHFSLKMEMMPLETGLKSMLLEVHKLMW